MCKLKFPMEDTDLIGKWHTKAVLAGGIPKTKLELQNLFSLSKQWHPGMKVGNVNHRYQVCQIES